MLVQQPTPALAEHFDLATHFDLKDRRTAGLVFNDGHIPEWKPPGFIRTEPRVCPEQHGIVKLFGFPLVAPASVPARAANFAILARIYSGF
jgi:hypothetical protein